jgi:hypothetical protein
LCLHRYVHLRLHHHHLLVGTLHLHHQQGQGTPGKAGETLHGRT